MDTKRIAFVAFAALLLAACADYQSRPKQSGGTLVGAGLGALAGSQIGAGSGRLATTPIGQSIAWNNPKSGNYGAFTPTRDGTNTTTGEYCREYQTTVTVGGKTENAYGTACRQPDGSWRIAK